MLLAFALFLWGSITEILFIYFLVLAINIVYFDIVKIILSFLIFKFFIVDNWNETSISVEFVPQFAYMLCSLRSYFIVLLKINFPWNFLVRVHFSIIINDTALLISFSIFPFCESLLYGIFLTYYIVFQSLYCFYRLFFFLHNNFFVFCEFWILQNFILLMIMKLL